MDEDAPDGERPTQKAEPKRKYTSFGGYQMDENGLFLQDKKHELPQFISGPFEILGRVCNSNRENWARLLRWSDDDNRVHIYRVSDADLHGDPSALCASLASRGLPDDPIGSNGQQLTFQRHGSFAW
jgi:hypothetical protein